MINPATSINILPVNLMASELLIPAAVSQGEVNSASVASAAKPAAARPAVQAYKPESDVTRPSAATASRPAAALAPAAIAADAPCTAAVVATTEAGTVGSANASVEGSQVHQDGLRLDLSSEEDPLLCTQRLPSSQGASQAPMKTSEVPSGVMLCSSDVLFIVLCEQLTQFELYVLALSCKGEPFMTSQMHGAVHAGLPGTQA